MVHSRVVLAKKPVFLYGSRGYAILYFAVSCRGPFSVKKVKEFLPGQFPSKRNNSDVTTRIKRLSECGYIQKCSDSEWVITELGVHAMVNAAAYRREMLYRTLGREYMQSMHSKISDIYQSNASIMEILDKEDEILEQINNNVKRKSKMKKGKSKAQKA